MSMSKLCTAISQNDHLAVQGAIQDGEDTNTCMPYEFPKNWGGKFNRVPVLLVAVDNHQVDILNILLQNNANVEYRGDFQATPLYWSAAKGFLDVAEIVLAHKANVSSRNSKDGAFAIHAAAANDRVQIGKLLITHGSPVDPLTNVEDTPLHLAAWNGRKRAVQWLVSIGANFRALNTKGQTPIEYAESQSRTEVVSFLKSCETNLAAALSQLRTLGTNATAGQVQNHTKKMFIFNFIEIKKKVRTTNGTQTQVVDKRVGAAIDSKNLNKTFSSLGYDVNLHENKTADQMNIILDYIQQDHNLEFVFLVILSHGLDDDTFVTSDGLTYSIKSIQQRFTDSECPHLQGRSKVILANFCRGTNIEEILPAVAYRQKDFGETDAMLCSKEPPHHMITIHASHEGFAAMRDPEKGTAFVYNLCASLQENVTQSIQDTFNDTYERITKNGGQTPKMEVSAPFAKFSF